MSVRRNPKMMAASMRSEDDKSSIAILQSIPIFIDLNGCNNGIDYL